MGLPFFYPSILLFFNSLQFVHQRSYIALFHFLRSCQGYAIYDKYIPLICINGGSGLALFFHFLKSLIARGPITSIAPFFFSDATWQVTLWFDFQPKCAAISV